MRTIRKRLLALLLTVAMLGTLFAGLPIASAASEALGNVTDAAVDGNTLLLTIDSGGSVRSAYVGSMPRQYPSGRLPARVCGTQPRHPDY